MVRRRGAGGLGAEGPRSRISAGNRRPAGSFGGVALPGVGRRAPPRPGAFARRRGDDRGTHRFRAGSGPDDPAIPRARRARVGGRSLARNRGAGAGHGSADGEAPLRGASASHGEAGRSSRAGFVRLPRVPRPPGCRRNHELPADGADRGGAAGQPSRPRRGDAIAVGTDDASVPAGAGGLARFRHRDGARRDHAQGAHGSVPGDGAGALRRGLRVEHRARHGAGVPAVRAARGAQLGDAARRRLAPAVRVPGRGGGGRSCGRR